MPRCRHQGRHTGGQCWLTPGICGFCFNEQMVGGLLREQQETLTDMGKIQELLLQQKLEQILNELIAINTCDEAFLHIEEPGSSEIAAWNVRRGRVAQIINEFQKLVLLASWEA